MTNGLKFRGGKHRHACYFAVAALLSNFCHGFGNSLGTFSSKMEFTKLVRNFENRGRRRDKMAAGFKYKLADLCFVMAAQAS